MRPSVDLPQPDSPTRPSTSPLRDRAGRRRRPRARTLGARQPRAEQAGERALGEVERARANRLVTPRALEEAASRHAAAHAHASASGWWQRTGAARRSAIGGLARRRRRRRAAQRGANGAARRQVSERRRHAGDLRAARAALACGSGTRVEQARACRDGSGARSTASTGPCLDDAARIHHRDAVGERRRRPRGRGVIQISAVPISRASALHLGQDLRLDRHVERGGRLVGDDQRRAGAAARWRWRRAGACRRRTGAGRRRAAARARGCRPGSSASRRARAAPPRATRCSCAVIASPSARRCAAPGSASSSGPGRPSRCGGRACARSSPRAAPTRSCPSKRIEPPTMRPGGSTRPRSEKPVTVLPEPDSPTRPSTSPARAEGHAVHRLHHAGAGEEMRREVARPRAAASARHRLQPRVELVADLVADQVDGDDQRRSARCRDRSRSSSRPTACTRSRWRSAGRARARSAAGRGRGTTASPRARSRWRSARWPRRSAAAGSSAGCGGSTMRARRQRRQRAAST